MIMFPFGLERSSLCLQKYLLPVEEIQEQPFHRKNTHRPEERLKISHIVDETMDEDIGDIPEFDEPLRYIYGDRIHADHNERERPF